MVCYSPMPALKSDEGKPKVFPGSVVIADAVAMSGGKSNLEDWMLLPCGQCMGCRLERSRQWAVRIMHEASMYPVNSFISLTYSPDELPLDNSLKLVDFQKFMKRLRKRLGRGVRYFHCGEYGLENERPHYHACIFDYAFSNKKKPLKRWKKNKFGHWLYTSEILEELWPYGFSSVGDLTFESAAYVARYCTKKITGPNAENHYKGRRPEYATMSRRPGIGAPWFDKYKFETYRDDSVVMRGREMKPPRFYDSAYELENPEDYESLKEKRAEAGFRKRFESTSCRLEARRKYCEAQSKLYNRRSL